MAWPRHVLPYMRPERTPQTLEQIKDSVSFVKAATEGKTLADYSGDRLLQSRLWLHHLPGAGQFVWLLAALLHNSR